MKRSDVHRMRWHHGEFAREVRKSSLGAGKDVGGASEEKPAMPHPCAVCEAGLCVRRGSDSEQGLGVARWVCRVECGVC